MVENVSPDGKLFCSWQNAEHKIRMETLECLYASLPGIGYEGQRILKIIFRHSFRFILQT